MQVKPRPLGNKQRELRDLSLMKQSDILHAVKNALIDHRDPYQVLTEIVIDVHETIAILARMDTTEQEQQ